MGYSSQSGNGVDRRGARRRGGDRAGLRRRALAVDPTGPAGARRAAGAGRRRLRRPASPIATRAAKGSTPGSPPSSGRRRAKDISASVIEIGAGRRRLRQIGRLARSRPRGLPPEFRGILRPDDQRLPAEEGQEPAQALRRDVSRHRAALRRAGSGAGGDLGAGDGLRRRHRRFQDLERAGDARLRLPPVGEVSRRIDGRAADRATRRPRRRPQMRGAWAGEIGQTQFMPSAYFEIRGGVRRQGHGGPDQRVRRRARLDRQFPARPRLEARRRLGRRRAEFRRPAWSGTRRKVYAKTLALFADELASAPESEEEE